MNIPCNVNLLFGRRLIGAVGLALVFAFMSMTSPVWSQELVLTEQEIARISPQARADLVKELVNKQHQFADAGIDNALVMAHFVAQVMTETAGLRRIDENLNYSYPVALRTFSRRTLPEPKARQLQRKPREFANWVYGDRLGNRGRHTDDGWIYRGSGYIQLTGRENFRKRGMEVDMPLEENPDLAREPFAGMKAAIAYWKAAKISRPANENDAYRVRVLVNGPAAHGFLESKIWFGKAWTKVFMAKARPEEAGVIVLPDEQEAYDDVLIKNGFLDQGYETTVDAEAARSQAIKDFQAAIGLDETGVIDENTEYELLDAWRYGDLDSPLPVPEALGEQTASFDVRDSGGAPNETVAVPTDAEQGSGETVDDVNIPQEDQEALATARGNIAAYEMGTLATDPERFDEYSIIGGEDTRKPVTDTTTFPARAFVQILFEDSGGRQYLCSGTMVSVDTVLTAAHCLHSGTSSGQPYRNFRVTPARNMGAAPFGRCKALTAFTLSGWTSAVNQEESRIYDLGALKLDCDVGQRTGWVGMRAFTESPLGQPVTVQGYAADSAQPGLQLQSLGALTALQTYKGFYNNDTNGGTSGAGVFVTGAPEQLIGVHTNGIFGSDPPWSTSNAFTRLTSERLLRIQEWIK